MLLPLSQGKPSLESVVGRLEITHHGITESQPTMHSHYTLGLIPGESTVFQKCYSNLGMFDIVIQAYKLEICVELKHKPTHAHPIHRALKTVGHTRFNGRSQALNSRLGCQLLISS